MKVLPMLVFAAAAGVGSGVMSFKYTSQLNYQNAVLALQVHNLERKVAGLRKQHSQLGNEAQVPAVAAGDRRARSLSAHRSSRR